MSRLTSFPLKTVLVAGLIAGAIDVGHADQPAEKALFYYVVDKSSSITVYGLTEPIRRAITEHAIQLPEETEIRLVFFSSRATEPKIWERMTPQAKSDFAGYFTSNFRPRGATRLYDSVGEVLEELATAEEEYRFVTVLVFSDGEDNWSRRFRSWQQFEPAYNQVVERHGQAFVYWITMEFEPKEAPPSWILHEPQAPGTKDIPIPEPLPVADFTASPQEIKTGEAVRFEAIPLGGRIEEFLWDFGDGNESRDPNPAHRYEQDGTYAVTLTTTGPGGEARELKEDFIQVAPSVPLTARFRFAPERPRSGETLRLEDLSGGEPDGRQWGLNGEPVSSEATPLVFLEHAGEVTIELTVTRGQETDTASRTITVLPPPPLATFAIQPVEAGFGETVRLEAEETRSDWTHTWTIDGDTTLGGAVVEWTADSHGLMHVVHTVEGPGGLARQADRIFVHPPVEIVPDPRFTFEPRFFFEGDAVVFRAGETGEGWVHEWHIDGEPIGSGVEHEWTADRTGNVSITHRIRIPDSEAVFEEIAEALSRTHDLVQVAFTASRDRGVYPLEVVFTDKSAGPAVAYRWDFGDGNTSNQRNPTHVFEEPGKHVVRLAATNPRGLVTESLEPFVVSVAAPMPLWQKAGIALAVLLILWVGAIVPFAVRPMLAPQRGPKFVGMRTYPVHRLRKRRWRELFWPRNTVVVGAGPAADIRLADANGARGDFARIERVPAAAAYNIHPLPDREIFRIERRVSLTEPDSEKRAKISSSRILKDGDVYEIAGERLTWHQPRKARSRRRAQPGRKRPLATANT